MDKIHAFITIPVIDLLKIAEKCSLIIGDVTSLIKEKVSVPEKEASSEEDPKATADTPKFKAPTFEDGVLQGMAISNRVTKPVELITE